MKKLKRLLALIFAFSMVMSTLVVSAEINYDKNNGYDVGEGVMISSTQMFNDGLVSNSGSNVKYDTGSSKTGTIVFDGDSSDKQLESVINIFGNQYKYDGVIDYAGSGKGKDTLKLTIKISSEKNYYAYVLVPGAKDIFMWIDDTGASTAAGSKNYKTPSFTAQGTGGYVYAIDCGTLSPGVHTLTFDGASGAWLPDVCAVAVYPADPSEFLYPYQNETLSFEERAADIVSRMTLEEKCTQLGHNAPAIPRLGISKYYYWREAAHGVVDQGAATSFPVSLSISNSWDPEMYNREAQVVSTEARVKNNRYNLNYWAPTINLSRDPRWGRNNESFGEDPYLTSLFGSEYVKGLQGEDEKYLKVVSCLKHFVANNCEYERQTGSSEMTEEDLRNYYSRTFRDVISEANPEAVMTSYNATTVTRNGEKLWDYISMAANKDILTNLLRRSWGFKGYIPGDCGAVAGLNGAAFKRALFPDAPDLSNVPQSATVAKSILAGNDLDCGSISSKYALEAIEQGYMTEADIDMALYRVFLQRFKTGEFDDTEVYRNYNEKNDLESDYNASVADETAEKGIVLLQNNEDSLGNKKLPLDKNANLNIALVGGLASQTYIGDYSGTPTRTVSPYEGLKETFGENNVHYLGHVDENDPLFNVKSITLVLDNGKERSVDLSKASNVSGMSLNGDSFVNVTQKAAAIIPSIDFSGVTSVKVEMSQGPSAAGGTLGIGYGGANQVEAKINSQPTADDNTYVVCESVYTGKDGGRDSTADLYITATANNEFDVETYKNELEAADVIIAYAGTIVGNAEPETGQCADGHESNDRTTISLPYRERHVSEICNAKGSNGENLYSDKTVVVMQTVGEVDVSPFKDGCRAILWSSYNGQAQGSALAKVLSGEVNPSGKLTTTWYDPADLEKMPCGGVHTTDDEGITWKRNDYGLAQRYDENGTCVWPGRTYMYYSGAPVYPFGYGLSYTNFEYSNVVLDKQNCGAEDTITASVNVKNSGNCAGTEIVQLYVSHENGDGIKLPLQQLMGFDRVELAAGETKTVGIKVDLKKLERYSEELGKNYVPNGTYTLWMGKNVTDKSNNTSFTLTGELSDSIKTVYTIPSGISVYGAYDKEKDSTAPINTITQEVSAVMADETVYDISKAAVRYESDDTSVAAVDTNGNITAGKKAGTTTVTAYVTINGEEQSASIPVVCSLQDAIPSDIRQQYITRLDNEYAGYNQANYREKYWQALTEIYNNARQAITDELDKNNIDGILTEAISDMSKVRHTLKDGEWAYTVSINDDWYYNTKAEIIYNGDEDAPVADIVTAIYESNGTLKDISIKKCAAVVDTNDTVEINNLNVGDVVKCFVWQDEESMIPLAEGVSSTITNPPAHVVYDLGDKKYNRLSQVIQGVPIEEVNGLGGFGNFNDVSNVKYNYTYNGVTYNLTGGVQGGKGSYTKSCVYFKPFDCYKKATVTALFDSAGEDRKLKIVQKNLAGEEIVNVSAGGKGSKNIVSLTAEITDLSQPVYIIPTVKESIYMIIVDYE